MAETRISGRARAAHSITDRCRDLLGDGGAFDEAVRRLRLEYDAAIAAHPIGGGATFRLVLTSEVKP